MFPFKTDPVLDTIALTPAPKAVPMVHDPKKEVSRFCLNRDYNMIRKDPETDTYFFNSSSIKKIPTVIIRAGGPWSIERGDDYEESCVWFHNTSLIMSPEMERLSQRILNWDQFLTPDAQSKDPQNENIKIILKDLWNYRRFDGLNDPEFQDIVKSHLEFTQRFSSETQKVLYSGYLPRFHLCLAILFEAFPVLRKYASTFPFLLTMIAEEMLDGEPGHRPLFRLIADSLQYGWRGLFMVCGITPDLKTVLVLKNIILADSRYPRDGMIKGSRIIADFIEHLSPCNHDQLLSLLPIHETYLAEWENLSCFTSTCPPWAVRQIHQSMMIENYGSSRESTVRTIDNELFEDPEHVRHYLNEIGVTYAPLVELFAETRELLGEVVADMQPDTFRSLHSPDMRQRFKVFEERLSIEEQVRMRPILEKGTKAQILKLLDEDSLSPGIIGFLHEWNDPEIDLAILRQGEVSRSLIRRLMHLYPEQAMQSPAMLFEVLTSHALILDPKVQFLLSMCGHGEVPEDYDDWSLTPGSMGKVIHAFGYSYLFNQIASSDNGWHACHLARSTWRTPFCPDWNLLMDHKEWRVRASLAMNPYIPDWVRQRLTEDPSDDVRWILAAQPWFVINRALPRLLNDTSPLVNHALAANPTLPEEILLKIPLLSHYTAALLAVHPKAGKQLQAQLEDFGFVLENHIHSVFARVEDPF